MTMRRLQLLLCLAIPLITACGGGGGGGSTAGSAAHAACGQPGTRCTGTAGGLEYILYTPAGFKQGESPLILALHSMHQTGAIMESWTELNARADRDGFAVMYPSAPGRRMWCWYFQRCNDVPALRSLIASVQQTLKADPKRIYMIGYSDGALMTQRAGVELGDVLAAIAPVSGNLYEYFFSGVFATDQTQTQLPVVLPTAANPVSVVILHDDNTPNANVYVCGWSSGTFMFPSQDEVFNYWSGPLANDCRATSTPEPICRAGVLNVPTKRASSCKGSADVHYYQLLNSHHNWHTTVGTWNIPLNAPASGQPYNPDLDATTGVTTNDVILKFFAAHPKP